MHQQHNRSLSGTEGEGERGNQSDVWWWMMMMWMMMMMMMMMDDADISEEMPPRQVISFRYS